MNDKREKFVQEFGPVREALLKMEKGSALTESLKTDLGMRHEVIEWALMLRPSNGEAYLMELKLAVFNQRVQLYNRWAEAGQRPGAMSAMHGCLHDANAVQAVIDEWKGFYSSSRVPDQIRRLYQEMRQALPEKV